MGGTRGPGSTGQTLGVGLGGFGSGVQTSADRAAAAFLQDPQLLGAGQLRAVELGGGGSALDRPRPALAHRALPGHKLLSVAQGGCQVIQGLTGGWGVVKK